MKLKKTITIVVTENNHGKRLDRFLSELPEIASRSFAQNLIQNRMILVDQIVEKASTKLKYRQQVDVQIPEDTTTELKPYNLKLDIFFEDEDLIVVNKPSGLVVHPSVGHEQETLVNALIAHTDQLSMKNEIRPGIVHRIDKETSGLLVIAKNDYCHEHLAKQFKAKTTHRVYYAVVDGILSRPKATIQSYLARHPSDRKKYASIRENNKIISNFQNDFEHGKWAVTHYEVLSVAHQLSYVQLKLETGRTHQIRVHMKEQGCSLVGDLTYGYSALKYKKNNLSRFYLHAAQLGFVHPRTDQYHEYFSSWPTSDQKYLISLGFSNELSGM